MKPQTRLRRHEPESHPPDHPTPGAPPPEPCHAKLGPEAGSALGLNLLRGSLRLSGLFLFSCELFNFQFLERHGRVSEVFTEKLP